MKKILLIMALAVYASSTSAAEFKAVAVRVQFSDCFFSGDDAAASKLLQSAETYFNTQFRGSRTFSFTLGPVVTLSGTLSHYGANVSGARDKLLYTGLKEACSLSDGSVDFSLYDNDGNGDVDLVLFIIAGQSEARGSGENFVWPVYSNFGKHLVVLPMCDGKQINRYIACTEIVDNVSYGDLGTLCHEFGHYLGLPDFYDTDGEFSGGRSNGLYGTSLMDGGSLVGAMESPAPINAVESYLLGTGNPKTLELGAVSLRPLGESGDYLIYDGPVEGEKYFFENRKGKGLMIYHYDRSSNKAGESSYYLRELSASERWTLDEVNCCPAHECVSLVTPSAEDSIFYWPAARHKSFGSGTVPSFSFWNGTYSPYCLADISMENEVVSFNVVMPIKICSFQIYQESAFISFKVNESLGRVSQCEMSCMSSDGKILARSFAVESEGGNYVCKISGLVADKDYSYQLTVYVEEGKFVLSDCFHTKVYLKGTCPYVVIPDSLRNNDGSLKAGAFLPLALMNVSGIVNVDWYLDGEKITLGTDGCLVLQRSGELRAVVNYESGKTEVFRKVLTVR